MSTLISSSKNTCIVWMHDFLVERKIFKPQSKPNATHQRQLVEMHLALPCGRLPSHKVVPNQDVGACQQFQMEVHRIRKISLALPRKDIMTRVHCTRRSWGSSSIPTEMRAVARSGFAWVDIHQASSTAPFRKWQRGLNKFNERSQIQLFFLLYVGCINFQNSGLQIRVRLPPLTSLGTNFQPTVNFRLIGGR